MVGFVCRPAVSESPLTGLVERAGRDENVPVLIPIAPATLARAFFEDGFHLNAAGVEQFTAALADSIHRAVDRHFTSAGDDGRRDFSGPKPGDKAATRWP